MLEKNKKYKITTNIDLQDGGNLEIFGIIKDFDGKNFIATLKNGINVSIPHTKIRTTNLLK